MKKLLSFGVGLALIALSYQTVFAKESPAVERTRPVRAEQAEKREILQDRTTQRCEVIQKKLDVQIARYGNNTEKHTANYQRMQARFDALVVRLQQAGKDTTELEAALVVLDEKIDLFIHNAASYIESLKLAQEYVCTQTDEGFRGKVTETRSLLQILRENVLDIRTYWQETLKPLIADLITESDQ